jgi:hypothetical protein
MAAGGFPQRLLVNSFDSAISQVNVAGKVTGVFIPIIKRQPGSDNIAQYAQTSSCNFASQIHPHLFVRYLDDSRADNAHVTSIPKVGYTPFFSPFFPHNRLAERCFVYF